MSEEEIERLKQTKKNCKSRLTKFKSFLEKYNGTQNKEATPVEEFKSRIEKVEEAWKEFDRVQSALELKFPTQDFESERIEFEEFYYKYIALANKFLNQRRSQGPVINSQQTEAQNARITQLELEIRSQREAELASLREMASSRASVVSERTRTLFPLPKLDLPTFSGAYDEWLSFRDAFIAVIHDDETIPKIQKLRYLRSFLKYDAARVIENLETTENNYEIAWNLLTNRFDNHRIIIQNHMQALFELPGVLRESSVNTRKLLDDALRHIRALSVLNQPVDKWDTPLIFLVASKLDRETRKEWEKSVSGSQMPTFDQLSKFLSERCQVLETINYNLDKNKSNDFNSGSLGRQVQTGRCSATKSLVNIQSNFTCPICNGNHNVPFCPEFRKMKINERSECVKRHGLCYNCLKKNHLVGECRSSNCTICNRRHHTLLHSDFKNVNQTNENKKSDNATGIKQFHIYDASKVLLSTAIIDIFDDDNRRYSCRVLLDSGSQPNIISRDLANQLNLKRRKLNLAVEVVNNMETSCSEWVDVRLKSKCSNYSNRLGFLVLPQITGNIPAETIRHRDLSIPSDICLADPDFHHPKKIDALIGAEVFYDLLLGGRMKLNQLGLGLQNTKLGWVVSGKIGGTWNQQKVKCNLVRSELNDRLEKFWTLEEIGGKAQTSKEEEICEEHFVKHTQRTETGRLMVRLPFNERKADLGLSYETARKRFFMLERRLEKNPELKVEYHKFMESYQDLNHMEPTKSGPQEGYYLPHQAVIKESSLTTKVRVVFDASAKSTSGLSLNDTLMIGPNIQDGIFPLILRFRCHNVVMSADIEKMYRQFLVHPQDRIYQKILWRNNPSEPLRTYQLNTVTYGTASAPFLATRCLQQLALDEGSSFPRAAEVIKNDMYVDDLLTGSDSVEEAKELRDNIITLTNKAGLNMCKWISNHPKIASDLQGSLESTMINLDPEKVTRTLGVNWNAREDILTFEVNNKPMNGQLTKREILSRIAQLFDPLGLVSPVVVAAKITLQELWRLDLDWDDEVPENVRRTWTEYQVQLPILNGWTIERHMLVPGTTSIQLHGFSDASMKAYGACIYLRVVAESRIKTTLVCAKSRVAPIKSVTLPRLELCGALLLARLHKMVMGALKINVDAARFWCDSTIVVAWIRSPPQRRDIFVANRISEIQSLTNSDDWSHVPTQQNPADFVSRGQLPSEFLKNILWKEGPDWLRRDEVDWPGYSMENEILTNTEERVMTLTVNSREKSNLWNRFSSMIKLQRFVAYGLRWKNNASKFERWSGPLSASEFRDAETRIVQLLQREEFDEEIKSLVAGKELSRSSRLSRLCPEFREGLLKVGGRIRNAEISDNRKFPILLPKNHPVTALIIREYHAKTLHAGVNTTLYAIRCKYWIVDGKAIVAKILYSCMRCFRANPREPSYVMGNLPKIRLTAARPFENTGIDFCGPFYIKEKVYRNTKKIKIYVAVFVCLSVKAVHLELVGDLTSESFIGCLRRFFSRRGMSRIIYSDNGTNFVGANNQLKELYSFLNSRKVVDQTHRFATERGIEWHFSPPGTPHFGGIWEAAVKSVKHHMRRVLRDTLFSFEVLNTFLTEIEAILNSRPLTPMSSDPNDLEALTPGHFLIGTSFTSLSSLDLSTAKLNTLTSWQHLQKLRQDLWKRWYVEYLSELNVRSKWYQGRSDIVKLGSLVVVRDENLPPLRWLLGRVIETHAGDDGVIRVVSIKTQNGICKRGIKKVSPLPMNVD